MNNIARSGPIQLDQAPRSVPLVPLGSPTELAVARKIILVFNGMRAAEQPGVTYRVYLGSDRTKLPDAAHYVGSINFFNAVTIPDAKPKPNPVFEMDVSSLATKLGPGPWQVLLVPNGTPNARALATIENVELVIQ